MTTTSISLGRGSFSHGHMWPRVATQRTGWRVLKMAKRRPRRRRIPIHITLDKGVVELHRSRFIEDAVLARLSSGKGADKAQNRILVPRPGFEPGARARKARMFDRATPPGLDIREGRAFKNLSSEWRPQANFLNLRPTLNRWP